MKKKRLKDKECHYKTIRITKYIHRYKTGAITQHKPQCFLVTIDCGHIKVAFRADSVRELFKKIKEEGRFYLQKENETFRQGQSTL